MGLISIDMVKEAMAALEAEGKKASVRAVQGKVGGGSTATVHHYMRMIRADQVEVPVETDEAIRPVALAAAQLVKDVADKEAKKFADKLDTLEADNRTLEEDLLKAQQENATLLGRLETLTGDKATLAAELANAKQVVDNLRANLRDADKTAARLEVVEKALEKAEKMVAEASKRRDEAKSLADKQEGRLTELEKFWEQFKHKK